MKYNVKFKEVRRLLKEVSSLPEKLNHFIMTIYGERMKACYDNNNLTGLFYPDLDTNGYKNRYEGYLKELIEKCNKVIEKYNTKTCKVEDIIPLNKELLDLYQFIFDIVKHERDVYNI